MSFKAPMPTFKPGELIKQGTYPARLYSFVDLGLQKGLFKGQEKIAHKVFLTFELPTQFKEFDGVQKPLVISGEYTLSMAPSAHLRPVVEGLIGTTFRDEEAYNFDFEDNIDSLLGKPCVLSVVHQEGKNGNIYANIGKVIPPIDGMVVPPQFNESVHYLLSMGGNEVFENLPRFLRDKIAKSESSLSEDISEALKSLREAHNAEVDINPEDIPF